LPLSRQNIFPGVLHDAWHREMQKFVDGNVVERLWKKDFSLWPVEEHELQSIKNNLRWLDLPSQVEPYTAKVLEVTEALQNEGLDHIVFVAMGSSNLAAAAVLEMTEAKLDKKLFLLDSTDPDALQELESRLPFERTLFVFSNKSGKRIETHTLFLYLLLKVKAASGLSPGRHFIALTEEGSYLQSLAREYKFRDTFFDPPGISGRYSGLIHFSLLLTATGHAQRASIVDSINAAREACGPSAPLERNPAMALASFLAAGELHGKNRLVLLTPGPLNYFAYRLAQVVGTSTSSAGRGLFTVFAQPSYAPEILQRKCLVAILRMNGHALEQPGQAQQLRDMNIPVVEIELQGPVDFAAEIFKWELATALACVPLGLNPFHGQDVQSHLGLPAKLLDDIAEKRTSRLAMRRAKEEGVGLYAEGKTRRQVSSLNLVEGLRTFLELRNSDSYIAILPFFKPTPSHIQALQFLRDRMRHTLEMPVQVSSGPRYVHALGLMYKRGPANGIFLVLTAEPAKDLSVPGAAYTFGELQLALALNECETLENAQKPVIRLHFALGAEKGLKQLTDVVIQAMARIRKSAG